MPTRGGAGRGEIVGGFTLDATISTGPQTYQGSAAFAGAGGLTAAAYEILRPTLVFAGAGSLSAQGTFQIPAGLSFAGAGSMSAAAQIWSPGRYDETGATPAPSSIYAGTLTELEFGLVLDRANLAAGDVLQFRVYLDGAALDSYSVTPSITVAGITWQATAAWSGQSELTINASILAGALWGNLDLAGVGSLSIDVQQLLAAQSIFAGTSQMDMAPQLRMRAEAAFTGTGLLDINAVISGQVYQYQGEASFAGVGSLAAIPRLLMAANAAWAASGQLSVSPTLLMRGFAAFSGSGNMSNAATMRLMPTLAFAGSSSMTTVPKWYRPSNANFAGVGGWTATTKQWMAATALFAGSGAMSATPVLRMGAAATLAGAGSMVIDLSRITGELDLSAQFDGVGGWSFDAMRIINVLEQWNGNGSFDQSGYLEMVASANLQGEGLLSLEVQQQLFSEVAFAGIGSMIINIERYGADSGKFICDMGAIMSTGNLVAAIATGSINADSATGSINTAVRCH